MNRQGRARAWETLAKVQKLEGLALRAAENAKRLQAEQIEARIRDLGERLDSVVVGHTVPISVLASASAEADLRRRESEAAEAKLRQVRADARRLEVRAREASQSSLTYARLKERSE